MRSASSLLILLLQCACRTAPPPAPPEWRESVQETLERYEPIVRDLLGSTRESPPVDVVGCEGVWGATFEDRVVLKTALEHVPRVLVHELAHWHWPEGDRYPVAVREGVAAYVEVAAGAFPPQRVLPLDHRTFRKLARLLAMSEEEFYAGDEEEVLERYYQAYCVVALTGLDTWRGGPIRPVPSEPKPGGGAIAVRRRPSAPIRW